MSEINLKGWSIKASDDGTYLYISKADKQGEIHIKAESEGYVVDAWSEDEYVYPLGTCFYSDLESGEDEE